MQAMPIRIFLVLFILFLIYPHALQAATERRIALVIGNSAYSSGPLKNPVNDAAAMATQLQKFGFTVILKKNANLRGMGDALTDFGDRLKRGGVGLFFYAGHGLQVGGVNYLVPIGARINRESDIRYETLDAGKILDEMANANNGLNIVILDACRDNPYSRSFRNASRGLAIVSNAPAGTFVSYSTSPGSVARDGDGRNSPFTEALLRYMKKPGLTIEQVFKGVRAKLGKETGGKQIPWELSSLQGEFYFVSGSAKAVDKVAREKQLPEKDAEIPSTQVQAPEPSSFDDLKKKMEERREKESQWVKDFEDAKKMEDESSSSPEKIQMWRQFMASLPNEHTVKGNEIWKYASNRIQRLEYLKSIKEINNDGRFIAYNNGTVSDTWTGLMWAAKDNGSDITWADAKRYCDNYSGGGYTDWRMPTQEELVGLHDAKKRYKSDCDYDVHLTELIRLTCIAPWASETRGSDAASFTFFSSTRHWGPQSSGSYSRALPVRSGK